MKIEARALTIYTAIAFFLVAVSPAALASTLTVNLNPDTKTATLTSVSTTSIIFTYPSGSNLSSALNGYHNSVSLSGSFAGSGEGLMTLQHTFQEDDSNVSIHNMTVSYSETALGNATAFVIHKQTNITASVKGIFSVVNGTAHIIRADLRWKAFSVPGQMMLSLGGHDVEVNQVGSAVGESFSDHPMTFGLIATLFAADGLWHRSTLNFSQLNTPLSTWTSNYDKSTNTTTFSKTISGESKFSASATFNGKTYSLTVTSDPDAKVSVLGYAQASGDTLSIGGTPPSASPLMLVGAAVIGAVAIGAVAFLLLRRSRRTPTSALSGTATTAPR